LFCVVFSAISLGASSSGVEDVELSDVQVLGEPQKETMKKPSSNRSTKERRNTLFRVLDGVLGVSHNKIHNSGNSDQAKQGWARVLVSAVSAYGPLLKDEELELRVIDLEEKLKNSVLIPKSQHDDGTGKAGRGQR
jgi:hypothetical protein